MNIDKESIAICELYKDTENYSQKLARTEINNFIEYGIKDEKGAWVKQSQVHKEIQEHIDECQRRKITNCGILAPWGCGKCFAEGTEINSATGDIFKIEDYKKEKFFDKQGKAVKPLWFGKIGKQRTVTIRFASGRQQVVTRDHPFMTQEGWKKAKDLKVKERILLVSPKYSKDLKSIKNAWLAGLYIGDGSYAKISCGDELILKELRKLGKLSYLGQYDYFLCGIGKLLKSCEIKDREKKKMPDIRKWDIDSICLFLAGYFDADGTVTIIPKYRKRKDGTRYQKARSFCIELYSINRDWLVESQYALLRLNIPSAIMIKRGKYKGELHISWRLRISGKNNMRAFRDKIKMKSGKAQKMFDKAIDDVAPNKNIYDSAMASEDSGEKECWGFKMPDGTHSIDGIVSHNTDQVIARTLYELGKNRNIRCQIICNTDENSTSRVSSIKRYIESDKDYNLIYPNIIPTKDQWGKHNIIIERESLSKDGTVESWGVTTAGTGSRADLQIFDDPVDMRNAILNPAMRQQVKDSFYNVWMSRLVPDGFRIYIATVWHEDDLTHELLKNEEWSFLVMKVAENFKSIECDSVFKGKYNIPLWVEQWSEEKLRQRRKEIGSRAYERGYRQQALSSEDRTFPSSDKVFRKDLDSSIIDSSWPRITGVDPFGQQVVIFTIALCPFNRKRFVVEIRRGKWSPKKTIVEINDAYQTHQSQIVVVENNASQEAIVQWASEVGFDIPIVPFTTGSAKHHPEVGLPSIEVEFANGNWICPYKNIDELDNEHPINIWQKELRSHPVAVAEDTIMAMWFAREGARFLLKNAEPLPEENIISQEDMGVSSVVIGDY